MALNVGELVGTLRLDDRGFTTGVRGAQRDMQQLGRAGDQTAGQVRVSWGQMATAVASGFAAVKLKQFAQESITAAAGLEQAVGGTAAVFRESAGAVDAFAETSDTSLGLSERAFRDLTTRVGGQLKNLGFGLDEAAQKSVELTQVGADLAATYGGTTQQAVEALGAAFRGEADPAEQFGLRLNINTANAKAVEMGLAATTGAVSDYARAQAIMALVMEQSEDALGQFNREQDTAAGRAQILSAQWENMQADLGQKLLPVLTTAGTVLSGVLGSGAATAGVGVAGLSVAALVALPRLRDLRDTVRGMEGGFGRMARAAGFLGAAGAVVGLVGTLKAMDDANAARMAEENARAFLALGDGINETSVRALAFLDQFGGDGIKRTFDVLNESNAAAAERFIEFAEAAGVSEDALQQMRDALEQKAAADRQSAEDSEANQAALQETGAAAAGAAEDVESLSDALDDLFDRTFSVQEAADTLIGKMADLQAQLAENTAGVAGNSEEALANRDAIREVIQAHFDHIDAMAEQGATADEVKARNAAFKDELTRVLRQAGLTEDQIRVYTDALDEVPRQVATTVKVKDQATSKLSGILSWLNSLPEQKRIDIAINQRITSTGRMGGVPLAHSGTLVPGGASDERLYILQGGERVLARDDPVNVALAQHGGNADLPQVMSAAAGTVTPLGGTGRAGAAGAMAAGAGGGRPGRVVIDLTGGDDDLLRWLRSRVRVEGGGDVQLALGAG